MRRTANLPLALLALLLAGVAIVAVLGVASAHDLLHRPTSIQQPTNAMPVMFYQPVALDLAPEVAVFLPGATAPEIPVVESAGLLTADPRLRPVGWLLWTTLPGATIVLAMLALMVGSVVTARRHGLYGRSTLRLLGVTGFVGLVGGPLAVLVEALAQRWTAPQGYAYTPAAGGWQFAALLVLLGCAFLAVRQVLGRASALRTELEGVI